MSTVRCQKFSWYNRSAPFVHDYTSTYACNLKDTQTHARPCTLPIGWGFLLFEQAHVNA